MMAKKPLTEAERAQLAQTRSQIYYKRDQAFQIQERHLEAWTGSERNKALIRGFQAYLFSKGTGEYRVAKVSGYLRRLCNQLGKDLDQATKEDIQLLVAAINRSPDWSEHTKSDYRRVLKQFFLAWFEDEDPLLLQDGSVRYDRQRLYRFLRRDVRSKPKENGKGADVITDEDRHRLIEKGCSNTLERAIVAVLHETGCRVGELLNMRIKDIRQEATLTWLRMDGKTGERWVPTLKCIPHLLRWLADHPYVENQNALLWISVHSGHYGAPLRYTGVRLILKRVFQRSGVKKPCNPHWFRHSHATLISPHYSDVLRCKMMGWQIGSRQVRTYTKMAAVDVEEKFMLQNGLKKQEVAPSTPICKCGAVCDATARYCLTCGSPLSLGVVFEDEKKKQDATEEAFQLLGQIMADPTMKAKFESYILQHDPSE